MEQYKKEDELGLPLTPYYKDLDKDYVFSKGEIGFTSFIVLPLWTMLNKYL